MPIKNKILVAATLLAFSWFTPLFTILSQLMIGRLGSLFDNASISLLLSNLVDMTVLLVAHIILMWVLLKKFNKKMVVHGIVIFALLNFLAGILVFRNPVSTQGLFYQTVNFLSNVIISNILYVPETGKPYMMLLPIVTLAIHVLLACVIPLFQTSEKEATNLPAENMQQPNL